MNLVWMPNVGGPVELLEPRSAPCLQSRNGVKICGYCTVDIGKRFLSLKPRPGFVKMLMTTTCLIEHLFLFFATSPRSRSSTCTPDIILSPPSRDAFRLLFRYALLAYACVATIIFDFLTLHSLSGSSGRKVPTWVPWLPQSFSRRSIRSCIR